MSFTALIALARPVFRGGRTLVLAGLAASLLTSALFAQGGGRVVDDSPERPIAERFEPLLEVEALLAQGNQQAALARLNALFESHPDRAEPRVAAGMLTAGANPQMARAQFERALQLDPRETYAIAGLARLDMQAGQGQTALNRLNQGLTLRPNSVELRIVLSELMAAAGRPAQAAGYLTEAFEVSIGPVSERVTLLIRAVQLEGGAGNWRAAEAAYSRAFLHAPDPETQAQRGNARYHMGLPRMALADWEAAADSEYGRRPDVAPALAQGIAQARAASVVRITGDNHARYRAIIVRNPENRLTYTHPMSTFDCQSGALVIDLFEHSAERGPWRGPNFVSDGFPTLMPSFTVQRVGSADSYGTARVGQTGRSPFSDAPLPPFNETTAFIYVDSLILSDPDLAERYPAPADLRACQPPAP